MQYWYKSQYLRGDYPMNYKLQQLKLGLARVNSQHVKLAMIILSLVLFVLGAGAPESGSDLGR